MSTTQKFNKGDIIRARSIRNPGETHENIVVHAQHKGGTWVYSTSGLYFYAYAWTFELVKPYTPPLPTTPGLYTIGRGRKYLVLSNKGVWSWLDFTASRAENAFAFNEPDVHKWADRLELLFDFAKHNREEGF